MSTEPQVSYGYQIEQENFGGIRLRAGILSPVQSVVRRISVGAAKGNRPREWFNIENQQNSSSCEGQSRSSAGEYLTMLSDGEEIQLSRYFAYLAAQRDGRGMRGDNGAYLEAGTRASARGIPLESRFPGQRITAHSEANTELSCPTSWRGQSINTVCAFRLDLLRTAIDFILVCWSDSDRHRLELVERMRSTRATEAAAVVMPF